MLASVRRHTGITLPDVALAAVLLAATLLAAWLAPRSILDGDPLDRTGALLIAAIVAPVLFRRAYPLPALLFSLLASIPYHALDYPHDVALPAAMVLLFTIALAGPRTRTAVVVAVVVLAVVTTNGLSQEGPPGTEILVPLGWLLLAAVSGEAVRLQRAYLAALTERADREAARRVAEERLRIARDLHDVLAHNIVVINANAGVAAHLLDARDDPALAELTEPLRVVASASGGALAELRATLDVLRGNDSDPDSERTPAPRLDRLPDLAEHTRAAGVPVAVETLGDARPLPAGVELTLYRITQEALTNVVRHANATRAVITVDHTTPGRVALRVTDDGRGPAAPAPGGYGIIGMAERVHALGGTLHTGPGPDGGFVVAAELPAGKEPA